jgi:type II pantothenate kinase
VAGTVGIDVGATLCKVARVHDAGIETARFPSRALAAAHDCVTAWAPERVATTGGGAVDLGARVGGLPATHVGEFAAWAAGAHVLAADDGALLPGRCLVVSLGTGTSVLALRDGEVERVGGTAVGGGTLLGLGRLLLGTQDFAALAALAARGDRRRVDLLVGDVYRVAADAPLLHDLTASNFAKLASTEPADVAHALMGLVGETVALVSGALATSAGVDTVVYCGSTLAENPALREVVAGITAHFGHTACFLARGAWCGAVGAAAIAARG